MIVPRTKLLVACSLVMLPSALLVAMEPSTTGFCIALVGLLLLVMLLDVELAFRSLKGISVTLPDIVRLSKDREGSLEIRIKNEGQKNSAIRLGLAWPREIAASYQEQLVSLPAQSQWSQLRWPCTPLKRGNFILDKVYLAGKSPLGFWALHAALPARSEIRVYPNLLTDRKNLAALFLNRGSFGVHAQRQVGKGRDFEKLREYVHGDSFDEIHWKATAKRGRPVTKVFQIERTQEIYVIVDASRLSARAGESGRSSNQNSIASNQGVSLPTPRLNTDDWSLNSVHSTLERFLTAALVLGLAAEKQGDLFGLVTFTDKVETFVRARNGKAHYHACRDAIYTLQPQLVTPDFDELCTFIRLRLRRRALLVFLTTLDDPVLAESFVRNVELIARQHLVLVNMLRPAGVQPLFSDANVNTVDDLYQCLGGHARWHKLRELEKVLQRRGVGFALLENEKLSTQLVAQYLSVKQRQIL